MTNDTNATPSDSHYANGPWGRGSHVESSSKLAFADPKTVPAAVPPPPAPAVARVVVPPDVQAAWTDRISIESLITTNRRAYDRSPEIQERYRELIEKTRDKTQDP